MAVDQELASAIAAVWRIPSPGPENLLAHPAFLALAELCAVRYGGAKLTFSLSTALRSLGLPCSLSNANRHLALDPETAALQLDASFSSLTTRRRHLCPLEFADDLPNLMFGGSRVGRFSQLQLGELFDAPRMARSHPADQLDLSRLAELQWLVVEETIAIDPRPEARSTPIFFTDMSRDFGAFESHQGRYPDVVERALFFLLLAPWEEWSTMQEVDWRGFKFPWIYTVDRDLAIRPPKAPDADVLAFETTAGTDGYGELVEWEQPVVMRLEDGFAAALSTFEETRWQALEAARTTTLMETPIEHFLVRAFAADGIDEVMAHMTAIEAAVSEESDHRARLRLKPDRHKGVGPSERVAARIAALLDDPAAFQAYGDLFDIRSAFVHGRASVGTISTHQTVLARSLARRVAAAVVCAAATPTATRGEFLAGLLDRGAHLVPAKP